MENTLNQLKKLRALMAKYDADFYYVPSADPHVDEYVPDHWQRRRFISQFTGSAGNALIAQDTAYLWTDARYLLQAEIELDPAQFQLMKMAQGGISALTHWLMTQPDGFTFAVDPKVITLQQTQHLQKAIDAKNAKLIFIEENLIDAIWEAQPPLPHEPIRLHKEKYAGKSTKEKLAELHIELKKQDAKAFVINALDAIAWLLNIRGNDIAYNPMVISNAIITQDGVQFFVNPDKISAQVSHYFKDNKIQAKPYEQFSHDLQKLAGNVWVDPGECNAWIEKQLYNAALIYRPSPISRMKAIKNPVEIQGMRQAHILDAIAMIRFFVWLEQHWQSGITELSAAQQLNAFRLENPDCLDLSFTTISGFGPNGAIIHYAVDEKSSLPIDDMALYLVDSGGQYPFGTTDITRTIHLGMPTEEEKHHYTLVLKGHLDLKQAIFPKGTCGEDINAFAHAPLWQEGLDFEHGTGHGVGCYSCVHEFPPRISAFRSNVPLLPGMITSNEPGVYFPGQYGIRIENLCVVFEVFPTGPFYGFKDLTLVPYCRKLINRNELSNKQISAINEYHKQVFNVLKPKLKEKALIEWLTEATKTIC